jgi:hypothetical protein
MKVIEQYRVFCITENRELPVGGIFLTREDAEERAENRAAYRKLEASRRAASYPLLPAVYVVKHRTVTETEWE